MFGLGRIERKKKSCSPKCARSLQVINKPSTFQLLQLQCEMDLEINIKEEPAWLEETTNASLENIELVSDVVVLKKEVKSELTEPGSTQEDTLQPSKGIKEEIFTEHGTIDQLVPYIKEDTKSRPEARFRCDVCGKILASKWGLSRHVKGHSGVRPFPCDQCGKLFSRSSHLSQHVVIHTDQRLYDCNICHKRFKLSSTLSAHTRTHTGEKPYTCNICGKSFSQSSHLSKHDRLHAPLNVHDCPVCRKTFDMSAELTKHMRSHTDVKLYRCTICNKQFSQSSSLSGHLIMHTEKRLFPCRMCNKAFSQKDSLQVGLMCKRAQF
ncbi:zinc finger protein 501-like isoform X1 [Anabrus simplex]|uniref:zinc finger protein 501-like isoform X1 n=2 Tax=Anabrus simplex TaxID=316456 RepID=UPI0035A28096